MSSGVKSVAELDSVTATCSLYHVTWPAVWLSRAGCRAEVGLHTHPRSSWTLTESATILKFLCCYFLRLLHLSTQLRRGVSCLGHSDPLDGELDDFAVLGRW